MPTPLTRAKKHNLYIYVRRQLVMYYYYHKINIDHFPDAADEHFSSVVRVQDPLL